jgi:beta-lactamase regulating signal transducer with metallopeptidase domain
MSGEVFAALNPISLATLLLIAKVSVVLLVALTAAALMQRASATSRHLVWMAALFAMLALPILAIWSPVQFAVLPSALAGNSASVRAAVLTADDLGAVALQETSAAQRNQVADVAAPVSEAAGDRAAADAATHALSTTTVTPLSVTQLIVGVWVVVATALLGWLAYGAITVRRIVNAAQPVSDTAWQNSVFEIADRLQLNTSPRLLRSAQVTMPFACGLRTPTIVLPAECESWPAERRTAVLLHELAHIRRRDIVGHTIGRVVCALYWFHPMAWLAAKRLRAEAERACDDLALNCGTRASDYAEHLLEIVTSVRNHRTPSIAMAMATRSEFEGRMLAILDPSLTRTDVTISNRCSA